ncbi:choice-of-anchor I family protein [Paenibacillus sp.]|uniref:choice-of-anchor I family protein n=1 Tax=Paenibacillus sp. TaxID=58172 RepID=UPI002810CB37|nr:choice-of-anchor I family protein [Paenibacillus sp.]
MQKPIQRWTTGAIAAVVAAAGWSGAASGASAAAEAKPFLSVPAASELKAHYLGRYVSGAGLDEAGAEIVAYDPATQRGFAVNGAEESLDIFDLAPLRDRSRVVEALPLVKRLPVETLTAGRVQAGDITSVALHPKGGVLAVAVPNDPKQENGHVVFVDTNGALLGFVEVGALPDMLTFTPDGGYVLVANEGEPNDDYSVDPEGSVSVIDVRGGVEGLTAEHVRTARFADDIVAGDVRKAKADVPYAQDLEPEYIAVAEDGKSAFVALQEANALGILDIASATFTAVRSLGYKNYAEEGGLDATDKDDVAAIRPWPALGMYMPDGMDVFSSGGKHYVLTANEGDSRDYEGYSEEARVEDMVERYAFASDAFGEDALGRLKTTIAAPMNAEGKYEAIYSFGARSYTIWEASADGRVSRVYDSGSRLEQLTKEASESAAKTKSASWGALYNADNTENAFDDRSDDKGPEPEAVATGVIDGERYAFVGLERTGGIYWQNVTNPQQPGADGYFTTRDFGSEEPRGDLAPEGMKFVPAEDSPNGMPLLLVAHEVSGTVAVFGFETASSAEANGTAAAPAPASASGVYVVKPGDTLSGIAANYGLTWRQLQAINRFRDPNLIYPGQSVKLPR